MTVAAGRGSEPVAMRERCEGMMRRFLLLLAMLALATAAPAGADATASPAPAPPLPAIPPGILNSQYGQAASELIQGYLKRRRDLAHNGAIGTVVYFKRFDLQVRTDPAPFAPSTYRTIKLHPGTEIDPRGANLAPGMHIDVSGQAQPDGSLRADRIAVEE